jgi:carboxylesterase type B
VPFQAALPQSPGFLPVISANEQENVFLDFLSLLKVDTIEEARQMSSSALILANSIQVARSTFGEFTYGPVVDGDFVPAFPGQLLLHGQFDRNVRILTGHNGDEGLLFTPFFIQGNASAFDANLRVSFPGISTAILDFILNTLYPDVLDGSFGYRDELTRAALLTSELSFTCNDNYMARAFGNRTFAYEFTIPPALHGMDVPYTFFNGDTSQVENVTVAKVMQEFITSFAITGQPSSRTWGHAIPEYGANANIVNLGLNTITLQKDETANPRCLFWQKALYY